MGKKQNERKRQPPPLSPISKPKKLGKQPPPSPLGPSLSTKSLTKSAIMGTKQEKQPLLTESTSASSSDSDESPPASSRLENPAGTSATAVLSKHQEPSDSTDEEAEEDEDLEADNESDENESTDDSVPVAAKPNSLPLLQASGEGKTKQTSSSTSSSGSGSEEGEGDSEEMGSRSDSDLPPLPPPHKTGGTFAMKSEVPVAENDSDSSSDSDQDNSASHKSSPSAAAPLSSKQVDCAVQPVGKSNIIASPPISNPVSKEKRKRANDVSEEAVQEKKILFKRIWSDQDELGLLRGILEYKEHYNVIPSNLVQLEPLHASIKGLMSFPVTLNQMFTKVRSLRQKYNKISKRINDSPPTLKAHGAAVYDLLEKIWGSSKDSTSVLKKKIEGERMTDNKNVEVKEKQNPMAYPALHRFIKFDHTNIPLSFQFSNIPNTELNELEGRCENLEISEARLHSKKQELFSAALELIASALAKRE